MCGVCEFMWDVVRVSGRVCICAVCMCGMCEFMWDVVRVCGCVHICVVCVSLCGML